MNDRLVRIYRRFPVLAGIVADKISERTIRDAVRWKDATERRLNNTLMLPGFSGASTVRQKHLPRLNWRATFGAGAPCIIECGEGVEIIGDSVFEGVWDSDFTAFEFDRSNHVYGSGVRVTEDAIILTPPSHPREAIFLVRNKRSGRVVASNSVLSCLATLEDGIRAEVIARFAPISSPAFDRLTRAGVFEFDPVLHEDGDVLIACITHNNLILRNGQPSEIGLKCGAEKFSDFASYRGFLAGTLSRILRNGASEERRSPLAGLCTISSGYDSTAVSALCAEAGVKRFATIDAVVHGRSDSGEEVARHLGVTCEVFEHPLGPRIDDLNAQFDDEHLSRMELFLATTGIGDDYSLLALAEALPGKMLFTGGYGDLYWERNQWTLPGFRLAKSFEKSITEYRLEKGFAVVPVPSFGALFPETIFALSHAREMKSWRVKGRYDRPIARRLVEECGVPREAFGQRKRAVNPAPPNAAAHKTRSYLNRVSRYLPDGRPDAP